MKRTIVRVENIQLTIYRLEKKDAFGFCFRRGGKRVFRQYRSLEKAKAKAREAAIEIANGRAALMDVTAADREIYLSAKKIVEPFKVSILEALAEWARQKKENSAIANVPISRVIADFDAHNKAKRIAKKYREELNRDAKKFLAAIGDKPISKIRAQEIGAYIDALNVRVRRRNNVRDAIVSLFNFARDRKFLPQGKTEAEQIPRIHITWNDPVTYTPEQLRKILLAVKIKWLPKILLGAFAGIRPEEIEQQKESRDGKKDQLAWDKHFDWKNRTIRISPVISKTKKARLVPISDTLFEWLEPWHNASGPVIDRGDFLKEIKRLKLQHGITWNQDALRHSFASYWLALHHNIYQLAEILGNSPEIIKRNYHSPKSENDAREWFSIRSTLRADNIVQFRLEI